jgi:hypothetical protein
LTKIKGKMVDIEQSRQHMRGPPPSTALPANHPLNIAYRILVMIASSYGLYDYGVFHEIMRGPNVSHEWFKVCLAAGIGELLLFSLRDEI